MDAEGDWKREDLARERWGDWVSERPKSDESVRIELVCLRFFWTKCDRQEA